MNMNLCAVGFFFLDTRANVENREHVQGVSEKMMQFSIFDCGKSKQGTATTPR